MHSLQTTTIAHYSIHYYFLKILLSLQTFNSCSILFVTVFANNDVIICLYFRWSNSSYTIIFSRLGGHIMHVIDLQSKNFTELDISENGASRNALPSYHCLLYGDFLRYVILIIVASWHMVHTIMVVTCVCNTSRWFIANE